MQSQIIASTDAVRNLYLPVAQAMRELADRLSDFCGEAEQERISILSAELKGVGWNSLFVSSSIDRFLQLTGLEGNLAGEAAEKVVSYQLDSLLVAANYLERSVKNLEAFELDKTEYSKNHQDAYACLVEKLGEIIRECQRSAKQ